MQGFVSIPFKTESGLTHVNGVAKFSPAGVVLEFESKLFGLISNGVKEGRIAIGDIHDVKFKKGFLKRGASIQMRLNSFAQLARMPNREGKLILKISAEDFERARDAVERLNSDLAEYAATLPPPQVSLFGEGEADTLRLDKKKDGDQP